MRRAAAVGVALVLVACAALVATELVGSDDGPRFAVGTVELRATEARLDVVVDDLLAMPPIPGIRATTPFTLGCRLDSGDLLQPSVLGRWEGTEVDAASAAGAVADALRSRGWEVSSKPTPSGALAVTKGYGGWRASGFTGPMPERRGAYVDVVIAGAAPCALADAAAYDASNQSSISPPPV